MTSTAHLYMEHVDRVDPSSPMGFVGNLSEIEQAMDEEARRYAHGKIGAGSARRLNYPSLDEKRALNGAAFSSSAGAISGKITSTSGRKVRRPRPASAGRLRRSASEPFWHTSVTAKDKKADRRRRRRPASAGRMRGSKSSTGILTSMTDNLQYGSGAGKLSGSTGGRKRFRLKEMKRQAKRLEQGWNQHFAQNLVSNKMIMANKDEIGTNRRRQWMNHHAGEFSALNELRRAILQKRNDSNTSKRENRRIIKTKKKKKKKKKDSGKKGNRTSSSMRRKREMILMEKTRMQSRRLQRKHSKSETSFDDGSDGISEGDLDDNYNDDFEDGDAESNAEQEGEKARHLAEVQFVKQCKKIRILFQELRIPQRDRRFFTKTFMNHFDERCAAFVSEQAELLEGHRRRTLQVLSCIRRRETAIKQLHAVAKACVAGVVPNRPIDTKNDLESDSGSENNGATKIDQRKRFRAILIDAAKRAQAASCLVIEAIVPWRNDLWRPQPFRWKGKNYILRMGNCVGLQKFVTSTEYVRAIRMCQLPQGTLDALLPPDVCEELCVRQATAEDTNGNGTKDTEPADAKEDESVGSTSPSSVKMSKDRINAACMVIQQEPQVVEELAKELDELLEKGYFIPRLRWNPNKLQSEPQENL